MIFCLIALAQAADLPELEASLDTHPALQAAALQAQSASALGEAAGRWMDPVVSLEAAAVPIDGSALGQHTMTGLQLRLAQRIPGGRERATEQALATSQVAVHDTDRQATRAALVFAVRSHFYKAAQAAGHQALTADHLAQAQTLLTAVQSRYEVGEAGQNAVLRLEVLRAQLAERQRDQAAVQARHVAALTALTGLEPQLPEAVEVASQTGDAAAWLAQSEAHPTQTRWSAAAEQQRAQAQVHQARAKADVDLWTAYRFHPPLNDPGVHFISVGVGVPLPMGQAKEARAKSEAALLAAQQAQAAGEAQRTAVSVELAQLQARWQRAVEQVAVHEATLLPLARSALASALADYQVGQAEFAALYDAQVTVLDLERMRLDAAVDSQLAAAQVARWTEAP